MKATRKLEKRRFLKGPRAYWCLGLVLLAAGACFGYYHLVLFYPSAENAYRYGLGALLAACALFAFDRFDRDRKNGAEKFLFASGARGKDVALPKIGYALLLPLVFAALLAVASMSVRAYGRTSWKAGLAATAYVFACGTAGVSVSMYLASASKDRWRALIATVLVFAALYLLPAYARYLLAGGRSQALALLLFALTSFVIAYAVTDSFPKSACAMAILSLPGIVMPLAGLKTAYVKAVYALALPNTLERFLDGSAALDTYILPLCLCAFFAALTARSADRPRGRGKNLPVAICAVACAAVYAVASILPANLTQYDASRLSLSTPADSATALLNSLETDVTATLVTPAGQNDWWIAGLLANMDAESDRFTARAADGSALKLIVSSPYREVEIASDRLYAYNYQYDSATQTYSATDVFYAAQQELLTAIEFVSRAEAPDIVAPKALLTSELGAYAGTLLYQSGLYVHDGSLTDLSKADGVLLNNPQIDLTEAEADALIAFLQAGGGLIVTTNYQHGEYPNLWRVLDYCGMEPYGVIAIETNARLYLDSYPYYLAPVALTHETTKYIDGSQVPIPLSHGIRKTESARDGLTLTTLFSTSADAYLKFASEVTTLDREEGDASGPIAVGMASEDGTMRCVWISGADFLADNMASASSGTTVALMLGIAEWTAGEGTLAEVTCDAPSLLITRLTVPEEAKIPLWIAYLTPGTLCLIAALILALKRKKA